MSALYSWVLMGLGLLMILSIDNASGEKPLEAQRQKYYSVSDTNIVFIKVPKTGGTSVGGALRRLGMRWGLSGIDDEDFIKKQPGLWANHGFMRKMEGRIRNELRGNPFVVTFVREPGRRAISEFYHLEVTRKGAKPTDDNTNYYLWSIKKNFQFDYICPVGGAPKKTDDGRPITDGEQVAFVLNRYNFVGVTERMDESIVAMAHMFRAPISDFLYVKAKDSHNHALDDAFTGRKYVPAPPFEDLSEPVRDYVSDNFTSSRQYKDVALWNTANRLLDDYTARIPNFNKTLACFQSHMRAAWDRCGFNPHDCLWSDNGCSRSCLSKYAKTKMAGGEDDCMAGPDYEEGYRSIRHCWGGRCDEEPPEASHRERRRRT